MYNVNINNEDVQFPSVSQILNQLDKSGALIGWALNAMMTYVLENRKQIDDGQHGLLNLLQEAKEAHKHLKDDAASIGTKTHKIIEEWIEYDSKPVEIFDKNVENCFNAFLDWFNSNDVEVLETEKTLISDRYYFAGTCDMIANVNGKKYLIDLKTSKSIYSDYKLQLAAYRLVYGDDINVAILRLDKEYGDYEFKCFTKNIEKSEKAFLSLLDYYYYAAKRRLKNNPKVKEIWK